MLKNIKLAIKSNLKFAAKLSMLYIFLAGGLSMIMAFSGLFLGLKKSIEAYSFEYLSILNSVAFLKDISEFVSKFIIFCLFVVLAFFVLSLILSFVFGILKGIFKKHQNKG